MLLAGGELDAGFTAFSAPVVNAFLRGARLKLVAGREVASPDCGDFGAVHGASEVFPDRISDFRQLRGMRIATTRTAGIADFALEMELASVGLSLEDVELTILGQSDGMAALLAGRVEVLVSMGVLGRGYPIVSRLVRSPALGSVLPNHQYSYVVFGKRLLEAAPDVGGKFLAANFRGTRDFLRGETPRFMLEFARSNNMDEKVVREACRNTFSPNGKIDRKSMQRYIDWTAD